MDADEEENILRGNILEPDDESGLIKQNLEDSTLKVQDKQPLLSVRTLNESHVHVIVIANILTEDKELDKGYNSVRSEILALHRMTKFDFPPHFLVRLMHSFPMMYYTMGSKLDGLAGRGHFLPKIAF